MGRIHPPIFVACPKCAGVSQCNTSDLRFLSREKPVQRLDLRRIRLIQARRACGTDKCGFLAEVHTCVAIGAKIEEVRRTAATWNFQALVCPECHAFLRESLVGDYQFEGFDVPAN